MMLVRSYIRHILAEAQAPHRGRENKPAAGQDDKGSKENPEQDGTGSGLIALPPKIQKIIDKLDSKLKDPTKQEAFFRPILLLMAVPPLNVDDSPDPCVNMRYLESEKDRQRAVKFALGLVLAGITLGESFIMTRALLAGASRNAATGAWVRAAAGRAGAGLIGLGTVSVGEQVYKLHVLCFNAEEMSDLERDRKIADILGNLYVGFALSSIGGKTMTGAEIKQAFSSSKTFADYTTWIYEITKTARNAKLAAPINAIIGVNFEHFYEMNTIRKIENLDLEKTYEINEDLATSLQNNIEQGYESSMMTNVVNMSDFLKLKIMAACEENLLSRQEIQELYEVYRIYKDIE